MERQHFAAELGTLRERILQMGTLAQDRLSLALEALADRRADLAEPVVHGDADINGLQLEIDDCCLKLLARQQPVARDLRLVTSVMKAAADLERIGDQAVNVAGSAMVLAGMPPQAPFEDLSRLAAGAARMLREAVAAFLDGDVTLARAVLRSDDEVDALRNEVFRVVIRRMIADPRAIESGLATILVSRNLERIADHATNIAEDVVFLVEGWDVRHQHRTP